MAQASVRSLVSGILRLLRDLIDFLRAAPTVMRAMTVEEHLRVGTIVSFWVLLLLPSLILPIVLVILTLLGIQLRLPF